MKKIVYLILCILFISACVPYRWMHKHESELCGYAAKICPPNKDTIIEHTVYDTIWKDSVEYEFDLAQYELFLECDSNNNVLISKVDSVTKNKILIDYLLKNNKLSLRAYSDSIKHLYTIIKELQTNQQVKIVTKIVPGPTVKVTPVWIWIVLGLMILSWVVVLVILFKLK